MITKNIVCLFVKETNVSITEYLTAIYILTIYNTLYDKGSNRDIVVSVPVDLRKYYGVQAISNFFTCMNVSGNVLNKDKISFEEVLLQVHNQFKEKLIDDNIKSYLARDTKLGNNIVLRLVPLTLKKLFMKYFGKLVNQTVTTTFSNIGIIKIDAPYKEYIDNIVALVNAGNIQKIKCTVCSYENNLTVTINSNLVTNSLEDEFYRLLKLYVGQVKLESNCD